MKIVDVREAIRFSRDYALRNGPIVLEMATYRYFGHSMSDPGYSYRTREEIKAMQTEHDPIMLFTKLIIEKGLMTEKDVEVYNSLSHHGNIYYISNFANFALAHSCYRARCMYVRHFFISFNNYFSQ